MSAESVIDPTLLEKIESATVVTIKPGDKIVISLRDNPTLAECDRAGKIFREFFGTNVLVVPSEVDFYVLRQEAGE